MDYSTNLHNDKSENPSKLLAAVALLLAIALPFLFVKIFRHKPTTALTTKVHSPSSIANDALEDKDNAESSDDHKETSQIPPIQEPLTSNIESIKSHLLTKTKISKPDDWVIIKTREHDSLAAIFHRVGLSPQVLQQILKGNPQASLLTKIKPNEEIQFKIKAHKLEKMMLPFNAMQYILVINTGNGYKTSLNSKKMDAKNILTTATINGSLYLTAKKNNIPYKLIRQMTDIFAWSINFAKDIKAGDQFTLAYKAFYIDGKLVGTGDILAVSYRNKGKVFQAVQHVSKQGQTEYYTPEGISLKKAFDRYPVRFSHISSTFSLARYHPILHYRRPHKGVDLAAAIGTPIRATGSGRIAMIGQNHGYGNMIKIKHDSQYSTVYGHMLRFQKGLSTGSFVRRGDIIGYVGQSGLASGPHCHFEFRVNDNPKNPTTINLPHGLAIPKSELASFKVRSSTLLAQLSLFEKKKLPA